MSNHNIYVTGHKHPDSDSICSAIAFANLLNKTGSTAIACRQGPLNEETKFILRRFHLDNPLLMTDARARSLGQYTGYLLCVRGIKMYRSSLYRVQSRTPHTCIKSATLV